MIDEELAELSASNAVLVSESKTANSQSSYLKKKLESERVIHREVEARLRETESVLKVAQYLIIIYNLLIYYYYVAKDT